MLGSYRHRLQAYFAARNAQPLQAAQPVSNLEGLAKPELDNAAPVIVRADALPKPPVPPMPPTPVPPLKK